MSPQRSSLRGDWGKGNIRDSTTWNVSYRVYHPMKPSASGTVQVVVPGGLEGKAAAGQRVYQRLRKANPKSSVVVRQIWAEGMTPGGLYLPPGKVWVDDEVDNWKPE